MFSICWHAQQMITSIVCKLAMFQLIIIERWIWCKVVDWQDQLTLTKKLTLTKTFQKFQLPIQPFFSVIVGFRRQICTVFGFQKAKNSRRENFILLLRILGTYNSTLLLSLLLLLFSTNYAMCWRNKINSVSVCFQREYRGF